MAKKTVLDTAREFRAGKFTRHTLDQIETLAAAGKTQASIAAALGVTRKEFTDALNSKKNLDPRLAYERGKAVVEQEIDDRMRMAAYGEEIVEYGEDDETGERIKVVTRVLSKSATILAIFYAKSRLGWREADKDTADPSKSGPAVQLILPQPMSREQYFKMVGAPIDVRTQEMKDITPTDAAPGLPAPDAPLKVEAEPIPEHLKEPAHEPLRRIR